MSYHTRNCSLHHCVFATKSRLPGIAENLQPRLWAYMGGIARANKMKALAVGGIADHCHILLSLPPTMAIAKAVQLIKAGSSKWIHEETGSRRFNWQEGYGAFTIGASQVPVTIRYIENQARHHKKVSSAEEWEIFTAVCTVFIWRLTSAVPDGTRLVF